MKPFSMENMEMPNAARSLCEEAFQVANSLLSGLDINTAETTANKYFESIAEHILGKGVENFQNLPPELFSFFNYSTDLERVKDLQSTLHLDLEDKNSAVTTLMDKEDENDEEAKAVIAFALLNQINIIKTLEDALLAKTETLEYKEVMANFDNVIHQLSLYLSIAKSFDSAKDYLFTKIKRKAGAKKGAEAKNAPIKELREFVLDEVISKHSEKTAVAAARIIAREFTEKKLIDNEDGKQLITDPVDRFTDWIREYRKKK